MSLYADDLWDPPVVHFRLLNLQILFFPNSLCHLLLILRFFESIFNLFTLWVKDCLFPFYQILKTLILTFPIKYFRVPDIDGDDTFHNYVELVSFLALIHNHLPFPKFFQLNLRCHLHEIFIPQITLMLSKKLVLFQKPYKVRDIVNRPVIAWFQKGFFKRLDLPLIFLLIILLVC